MPAAPTGQNKSAQGNALGTRDWIMASPVGATQTVVAAVLVSPLQGLRCHPTPHPGRCPGLSCLAPLGRKSILSQALRKPNHEKPNRENKNKLLSRQENGTGKPRPWVFPGISCDFLPDARSDCGFYENWKKWNYREDLLEQPVLSRGIIVHKSYRMNGRAWHDRGLGNGRTQYHHGNLVANLRKIIATLLLRMGCDLR